MASPTEIAQGLPETLPDDFGEWDGGNSSATPTDSVAEAPAGASVGTEPPAQHEQPEVTAAHPVNGSRNGHLPLPAANYEDEEAAFLQRLKSVNNVMDRLPDDSFKAEAAPIVSNPIPHPPTESNSARVDVPRSTALRETASLREATPMRETKPLRETASLRESASLREKTSLREADEFLFQSFRSKDANKEEKKPANRKWQKVTAIGGGSILLLGMAGFLIFNSGSLQARKQALEMTPTTHAPKPPASSTDAQTNTPKPSPSTLLVAGTPTSVQVTQQATDSTPATDVEHADPAPVQSTMMNDQLTAPRVIPQNIKTKAVEEAPPGAGLNPAYVEGMGGTGVMGSVLNGQARLKVQPATPRVVTISAGVAVGLLMKKTTPVYPVIAKSARVSGTVVLEATISKTGTITDLHVVSGPTMLRQAALEAVQTWRYRPYQLDNAPTEVQTTVNVVFSLNQ